MYQPTCVDVQSVRTVTLSFILFELFPLELCQSQKTIIYDYFIQGYDCAIVNYIDRYLYWIRADCLHEMTRISVRNYVFNVSV